MLNNTIKALPSEQELEALFPETFDNGDVLSSLFGGHVALVNRALNHLGVRLNGMLHLGGHTGQELAVWHMLGARQILIVEPQSHLQDTLTDNADSLTRAMALLKQFELVENRGDDGVRVVQAAVSDVGGRATLNVNGFDKESSLLQPIKCSTDVVRTEEVEVKTIAQILEDLDAPWQAGDFNGMWLNIQGSELAALRGAGDHLQHFDFVMLEINFDQRYDDCPLAEQIDAFMRERQFTPFSAYYFHQDYGYIIYTR